MGRTHQRVNTLRITVRDMRRDDNLSLEVVLEKTGLFPSDMLLPMAEPWLSGRADHRWLVALDRSAPVGFAYTEPERLTEGTFNLLAIAVQPEKQGQGVGKTLVSHLMQCLRNEGGRILLVETSSLDELAATRALLRRPVFHAGSAHSGLLSRR